MIRTAFIALAALTLTALPARAAEEVYGSWIVRCKGESVARQCEAFQRFVQPDTGKRVMELAFGYHSVPVEAQQKRIASVAEKMAQGDEARAVLILPLGVMIPDGVMLLVDNIHHYKFAMRYCLEEGCYAELAVSRTMLDKISRAMEASVVFRTVDRQDVSMPLTLDGLTAALHAIR